MSVGVGVGVGGGLRDGENSLFPVLPISLWRFDDATGDDPCVDAFGGNDLTAAETHTRVAGVVGFGQVIGASGFAVTSDDFNYIDQPFTAWVLFKRSAGTDTLRVKYEGADIAWVVDVSDIAIVMQADLAGAGLGDPDAYTTPSDTWTFVCGRYNGSSLFLNVNARTEVESVGVTTLSDQTGGTLTIVPTGTVAIDHSGVCNYCMTDLQVATLHTMFMAGASPW